MYFKESTHSYINDKTEEKYISVTTYLSSFSKKKDWNNIAKGYLNKHLTKGTLLSDLAKKWGVTLNQAKNKWSNCEYTVDWLLSVWNEKKNKAANGGSTYHNNREIKDSIKCDTIYNPVINDSKSFIELDQLESNKVYLELGIGSHLHKIWGQADKVIIKENKHIDIRDYKTNAKREDLNMEGIAYYNPDLGRKAVNYMLPPVSNIIDNNYWKYCLQLSMYAYLLELHGFVVDNLFIDYIHTKYIKSSKFNPKKHELLSEDVELDRIRIVDTTKGDNGVEAIKIPYLKREIIDILKFRQAKLIDND